MKHFLSFLEWIVVKHLIQAWEETTENLTSAFIDKYYGKNATDIIYWVGGKVGEVIFINDDYWDFKDIATALRLKVPKKELFKWHGGKTFMNLQTYAKTYGSKTND